MLYRMRHLLLVESKDDIPKSEIAIAKCSNVDVIYVTRETLFQVCDVMRQYNTRWRSINLLFHGSANLGEQSISIFNVKMSMNRNIMMYDPNVRRFSDLMKAVAKFADESLFIYTCAVGIVDGLKELCIRIDDDCKLTKGVFLSTNTTGNAPNSDWNIEWGTKLGFLTDGISANEIQHAEINLFRDISKLTFVLSDEANDEQIANDAVANQEEEEQTAEIQMEKERAQQEYDQLKTTVRGYDARTMTPNELRSLTTEEIPLLLVQQINKISVDVLSVLSKKQISAFTPLQITCGLTVPHIESLTSRQLSGLTELQIPALIPVQIVALSDKIALLSDKQIGFFTPIQVSSFSRGQIQALETRITLLTPKHIQLFTKTHFQALTLKQIQSLTKTQILSLKSFQIKLLKPVHMKMFSEMQLQLFTNEQVKYFTYNHIIALDDTQLRVIISKLITMNQKYWLYSIGHNITTMPEIAAFEKYLAGTPTKNDCEDYYYRLLRAEEYRMLPWTFDADVIPKLSPVFVSFNFHRIPTDKLSCLTDIHIQNLSNDLIKTASKTQIQAFGTKIGLFTPLQFSQFLETDNLFTDEQMQIITLEQRNAYTMRHP